MNVLSQLHRITNLVTQGYLSRTRALRTRSKRFTRRWIVTAA